MKVVEPECLLLLLEPQDAPIGVGLEKVGGVTHGTHQFILEKGKYTFNDIIEMYNKYPYVREMMLTGGSPTMHPDLVNELTHFAYQRGLFITIETEGSHFIETDYPIGLVSLSPKFSNSNPRTGILTPQGKEVDQKMINQHNKLRLNKEAIRQMLDYHDDFHFKPVCNPIEMPEVWEEIEAFRNEMDISKRKNMDYASW